MSCLEVRRDVGLQVGGYRRRESSAEDGRPESEANEADLLEWARLEGGGRGLGLVVRRT